MSDQNNKPFNSQLKESYVTTGNLNDPLQHPSNFAHYQTPHYCKDRCSGTNNSCYESCVNAQNLNPNLSSFTFN